MWPDFCLVEDITSYLGIIMKLKNIIFAGAMVALMGSQSVLAGAITLTLSGSGQLGSARLGTGSAVGYESGHISPHPTNPNSDYVFIGGDSFTATGVGSGALGEPFDAWCVDILNWLVSPSEYDIKGTAELTTALADTPRLNPGKRVHDLGRLANAYYDSLYTVHTKEYSAAFQLAVWAITYGTNTSAYSINTSDNIGFSVDSVTDGSTFGVLADAWLTSLNNNTAKATANYSITYLSDANGSKRTQDLVVFKRTGGATVPEPGTIALLGIGLLAASLIRRRKH